MEGKLFQETKGAQAQHLVSPDDETALDLESEINALDRLSHHLDIPRVGNPQAFLVTDPEIGDSQGVKSHHLGRHRIDGYRVSRGQQIVLDHRFHGPGSRAVSCHRAIHHREHRGMQLPLHHHQVNQHLVDVLVSVMPDFLQESPEGVLDCTGGSRVAVSLNGRQVQDIFSGVVLWNFDSIRKNLIETQEWRFELVDNGIKKTVDATTETSQGITFDLSNGSVNQKLIVRDTYYPGWQAFIGSDEIHFSLAVFLAGAFWAWMYERSGGVVAPWISHALVDIAIMAAAYDMLWGPGA